MTPEQKQAVSSCIHAFNIPLDAHDFVLTIRVGSSLIPFPLGISPQITARLEVGYATMRPSEVAP